MGNNPVSFTDPSGLKAADPVTTWLNNASKGYVDLSGQGFTSGSQNLTQLAALVTVTNEAIIYQRTGPNGECYVGSSCSPERYGKRQVEHDKTTGRRNEYEILQEKVPADQRRFIEEKTIRENGGPGKQGGTLENKRYEMNDQEFQKRGGTTPKPTSPAPTPTSPRAPGIRLPGFLMIPGLILEFQEFDRMMNDPCYQNPYCA